MTAFLDDLRIALRGFLKSPVFVVTAVLTLALGIGANTAIFSVVHGVLLRSMPFDASENLVMVWETKDENQEVTVSAANFVDWQERSESFEQLVMVQNTRLNLIGGDEPERVVGARVSPEVFEMLRVQPAVGRAFAAEEDQPGRHTVAILSHGFWQRRFGGDEALVGQTVQLDTSPYTVIGILPEDFRWPLPMDVDIWVPRVFFPQELTDSMRRVRRFQAMARLRSGVSLTQAQADLDRIAGQLEQEYPVSNAGWGLRAVPLLEQVVGKSRSTLLLLFGAVALVLLVACANVGNLMVARSASRGRETALRLALGANRWHLSRLWLAESLLLAFLGGAVGWFLALLGTRALIRFGPEQLPRIDEITFDPIVLLFTLAVTLLAGLIFALAPVWSSTRVDPARALQEGSLKATTSRGQRRLHSSVVVVETALALLLLLGAGLLTHSFYRLRQVDPGFQTEARHAFHIFLPPAKYREPHRKAAFWDQTLERIGQIAGVRSAGAVMTLPLGAANLRAYAFVEGQAAPEPGKEPTAAFDGVSPGYFETMGIPLVQGRFFDARDHAEAPAVLIVNEALAEQFFPNQDPIGQRMSYENAEGPWKTIVGVVGNVKHRGLDAEPRAEMYHPQAQDPFHSMNLVIRSDLENSEDLATAVRQAVWEIDGNQPVTALGTLDEVVAESLAKERFTTYLFGLFALVALLLGSIGIYGVVAHLVGQSLQEVGIRLALGARPLEVLGLLLRRGLAPVLLGVVLGLGAAWWFHRILEGMLYQISALDPWTFAVISLLLLAVGLVASWIPARRALAVDPVASLRYE